MTHWTPAERAHAIGLGLAVGADKAHEATGVPRRTISSWLSGERPAPELDALVTTSRETMLATLQAASAEGAASLLSILRSPDSADRDKVRAAEVAIDRFQLMSGGVTARTENFSLHADAGSIEYDNATPEVQMAADRLVRDALTELVTGASAAALAGVAVPRIELDGLRVRAALSPTDQAAVTALLAQLEGALAAGVDAGAIIEGLTKTKTGGTDA